MRHLTTMLCLLAGFAFAEQKPSPEKNAPSVATLTGDWKGTSICKARPGICHDEVVVYHIKLTDKDKGTYVLSADKIVNGELEWMGTLECVFAAKENTLTCHYSPTDTWTFKLEGEAMHGTLVIPDNLLMRVVEVKKVKKDWRKE